MNSEAVREQQVKYIKDLGLEEHFLKLYGIDSFNDLTPTRFAEFVIKAQEQISLPAPSPAPVPAPDYPKSIADSHPTAHPTVASDVLAPFSHTHVNYNRLKGPSYYQPSCLAMDYLLHEVNLALCDNDNFLRYCPSYHPYYLRLYYGILFWIQCLRAREYSRKLTTEESSFLESFNTAFPYQGLPICGPLLLLFKTLCCSQPEIDTYGLVIPELPARPGPEYRHEFIRGDLHHFFLPNIPGIFALIDNLHDIVMDADEDFEFPEAAEHVPIPPGNAQATFFGTHLFSPHAQLNEFERYSLNSPGLQFPCEADSRINRSFSREYDSFYFPALLADDELSTIEKFLHLTDKVWFEQIVIVAAKSAAFFNESGTLADCAPFGLPVNQITCHIHAKDPPATAPAHTADASARLGHSLHMTTSMRQVIPTVASLAAASQTHIAVYPEHPFFGAFGNPPGTGRFWTKSPIEKTRFDGTSFKKYREIIPRMMKEDIN